MPRGVKQNIDKEVLEVLYNEEKFKIREIAQEFGISPSTVMRIMADHGMRRREGNKYAKNPNGYVLKSGYKYIYMPEHPNADTRGYMREHRLVMEEYLGRPLERDECVFFLDGDKMNTDIKNLELVTYAQAARCGTKESKRGPKQSMIGRRYGRLEVIGLSENRRADGRRLNLCKCDCGNIVEVDRRNLYRGHTKSCGCIRRQNTKSLELEYEK